MNGATTTLRKIGKQEKFHAQWDFPSRSTEPTRTWIQYLSSSTLELLRISFSHLDTAKFHLEISTTEL